MPEENVQTDPVQDEDRNIWQDLLAETSQQGGWSQAKDETSTLIVLGDKSNGKSSVLNKFANHITNAGSPGYILDYSYMNVKNKYNLDKDETVSRMSVWQLDDHAHSDLLVNLVAPQQLATGCYMITADLSKPWEVVTSTQKWLDVAKSVNEKLAAKLTEEQVLALKTSVSKYNQFFVDFSGIKAVEPEEEAKSPASETAPADADPANPEEDQKEEAAGGDNAEEGRDEESKEGDVPAVSAEITQEEANEIAVDLTKPEINLGVPVVIVCNKADFFNRVLAKQGADERFELIAHQLRALALKYGASLVFTSAFGEGVNVDLLQDYLFHRMFKFPLQHSAKVVGSAEDVGIFTPAGYDSQDLIASGTALKNGWTAATNLAEVFENPGGAKTEKAAAQIAPAASNEDFFKSLASQLESGVAAPIASPAADKGADKNNQKAVKSFFKSLLSGPAAGAQRDAAKEALTNITAEGAAPAPTP